jgi:hypothetical protein
VSRPLPTPFLIARAGLGQRAQRVAEQELFRSAVDDELAGLVRRRITQDEYDKKARELKERQAEIATCIDQHQQGDGEYRTTLESLISLASRAAELLLILAKQHLAKARDCIRLAERADKPDLRNKLVEWSQLWMEAARRAEKRALEDQAPKTAA